jgi:hypothetical protein
MTLLALQPGALVHVRQRRWVVEQVRQPPAMGDSALVDLACIDDDAQGQPLSVLWQAEPDARMLDEDAWAAVGGKGFDSPEVFAAYLNTRRWNSVTATTQQLDGMNPAIMAYIRHLHVATAGFIAATAIAARGLAWYGVCRGYWWAWITAVIAPVVGLAVALPLHWMGHFNYDWVSHLGPIYVGTVIYVVGALVALIGLAQAAPSVVQAAR